MLGLWLPECARSPRGSPLPSPTSRTRVPEVWDPALPPASWAQGTAAGSPGSEESRRGEEAKQVAIRSASEHFLDHSSGYK